MNRIHNPRGLERAVDPPDDDNTCMTCGGAMDENGFCECDDLLNPKWLDSIASDIAGERVDPVEDDDADDDLHCPRDSRE